MIACLYVVYTYYVHILGQRPSIASYTIPTVPWSKCADCAPSSKLAAKAGHYDCMSVCRIYVLCAFYGPAPLHRKLHDSKDYTNCTLTVHAVAILRHLHPLRVDIRIRCLCLRWVPTLWVAQPGAKTVRRKFELWVAQIGAKTLWVLIV